MQRGRDSGSTSATTQFKAGRRRTSARSRASQDDAKFQAALKQEDMTIDDLRKHSSGRCSSSRCSGRKSGSKLTITEEEARQYYLTPPRRVHRARSHHPARDLRRGADATERAGGVNVATDDDAQQKAEDVRARVLKGEDFAKVAAEVSESPSKANGGLIGPFYAQRLSPQLQQLVDKMKPGDITPAVRTPRGYQLFKLETLKAAAAAAVRSGARPHRRQGARPRGSRSRCGSSSTACATRRSSNGRTTS